MAGRLNGKVALITGTGSGQGRAAAILFAREGATVCGCGARVERIGVLTNSVVDD